MFSSSSQITSTRGSTSSPEIHQALLSAAIARTLVNKDAVTDLVSTIEQVAPKVDGCSPLAWDLLGPAYAMQPADAAECLGDLERTTSYVQVIAGALAELRNKLPQQTIRIIDVGTGPFAFLALVAMSLDPNVTVDAFECTESSAILARETLRRFGYEDRVCLHQENFLTTTRAYPVYDLALTETFDAGMLQERGDLILEQLSMLTNTNHGIRIPHAVAVEARVIARPPHRHPESSWIEIHRAPSPLPSSKASGPIQICRDLPQGRYQIELRTKLSLRPGLEITVEQWQSSPITRVELAGAFEVEASLGEVAVTFHAGKLDCSVPLTNRPIRA